MHGHESSGTVSFSPPTAVSAAALSPGVAVADWAENLSLPRLTGASAGDSCEGVKVGSSNCGIYGIYCLVIDSLDQFPAAAPLRIEWVIRLGSGRQDWASGRPTNASERKQTQTKRSMLAH